ncbi:MAG: hypothetical protein ACTH5B_01525 [Marinomonas sp.]|uniref:hypothetical protein n=1 Tax=Marinomonas sp. TaxID=1904862 RepID=UPI003F967EF3
MPYDKTSVGEQSCAYEESQALKILKRIFGYFLGASKKLPAQQGGIKVGNAKRLNGTKENQKKAPQSGAIKLGSDYDKVTRCYETAF